MVSAVSRGVAYCCLLLVVVVVDHVVSGRAVLSRVSKEAVGEIRFRRPVGSDEVPPHGLHTPPTAHAGGSETR